MTKFEQKQIDRAAAAGGLGTMLHTLAIIHRAGSTRTQKEVAALIDSVNAWSHFSIVNGALLYRTETNGATAP